MTDMTRQWLTVALLAAALLLFQQSGVLYSIATYFYGASHEHP